MSKIKKSDHFYLIDGSGYIFRAYYALPPLTRKSDGLPVGAVSGFCNMLFKLLEDTKSKDNKEKAEKLYSQAFKKLSEALKTDKNNPDILNYMGFTSRKIGNFSEAENYYLKGLAIDPKHNGINEYLGELYVQTDRIDKAKERLEVLKNCNCEEYAELELIIKTRGSKVY